MKSRSQIVPRILDVLRRSKTVALVSHVRPDGDSIGSQLALAEALDRAGKSVVCWNEDPIPAKLAFLDRRGVIQSPCSDKRFDCVVALDAASLERLGSVADRIRDRSILINIDHHISNTRFGDINWISHRNPSTGELVFRLLKASKWPITATMADCLFTAVSTDTGSFQYPSTRPATYAVAGELVKRGANLATICQEVYQSFPLSRVRLIQHTLNNFKLTDHNRIAYFWLRPADYARARAGSDDSEGLIDHIRAIEPVVVACLFEQMKPNLVRISMRSKNPRVDVNEIARQFNGGGHPAAAGARIAGSPEAVQRAVIRAIRQALKSVPMNHADS
ncbi:MAG TPA: DHH family phosphoesterase [Candidatus Paceibacterota bacterium]|nr:DHH family phosphoesterase [Verrucomicrobiota bacterium]HRY46916.1 DHH family phosphoesterase [Candidatus Paceibacterota bacterium]HSA02980.1 DHH family phosphoesterase [Candidatus Paceibacterota bacterium]